MIFEADKAKAPPLEAHAEVYGELSLKVLAADDNASNRAVLAMMLGPLQVDLDMVVDGAEAVAAAKANRYDVILMDAKMPVMDGETAIREIRAWEAANGLRTPIVMLTANVFPEDVARYRAAGADDVAAKPIDVAGLYACLQKLMATSGAAPDIGDPAVQEAS